MDDLYRDYILDHYKQPRNFGELEPHDLEALEHNPSAAMSWACTSE